jgi:cytochrome c
LDLMNKAIYLAPAALLLGLATVLPAQSAPKPDGATLYRQRCAMCHGATPSTRAVLAPVLAGVLNRKAGSTAFNYSPALKASNLTWTRPNLDRYLQGPMKLVPGTRMVIAITDPAQRAAVLGYITLPPPPAAPAQR